MEEDAILVGIDQLLLGLMSTKSNEQDAERAALEDVHICLMQWRKKEVSSLSLRSKLISDLMQPPGSVARLYPVPQAPGVFCDANSSLMFSKSVLIILPVHPLSNVTLVKLVPRIPGVPPGFTTTPPLFFVIRG